MNDERLNDSRLAERLQVILDISRKMTGSADTETLLQEITRACHHLVDANSTTIFILNAAGDHLVPKFTDDPEYRESKLSFQIPVGTGLTGHVVQTGQAAIVNDAANSTLVVQVPGTPDEIDEVLMSVPLMVGERVLGAITTARAISRPFAEEDLEIISILAGQAAALLSQAELIDRIAQSEQRLRSLVENAEIGLFTLDADGNTLAVNPYIRRKLGPESDEPVPARQLFGGERGLQTFMAQLTASRVVEEFQCTIMRADGRLLDLRISGRLNPSGQVDGMLSDHTDLTRLERENLARLSFLENLLAQLQLGLVILEPSGKVRYHNPAFARLLSMRDDAEEHPFQILRRLVPEVESLWQRCLRHEADHCEELELPVEFCEDGGMRQFSAATVPVSNATGVLTDVVFLFEDVSERRALRNQLIQTQKMDSVGSLASGLAHDFNNFLSGILGNTAFLRQWAEGNREALDALNTIERSVGRAAQLTRQLLGFARQGPEQLEPEDLNHILTQALDMFRRGLPAGIQIDEDMGRNLPRVKADSLQVEQALLNVLMNAVDSVGAHGTIRIRSRHQLGDPQPGAEHGLAESPAEQSGWVALEIQDSGKGIPEKVLPRVFDPFFTTKEPGQGSGLGLAMVFNIMQRHGGRAEIQSRVGYGTRLRLLFPVIAPGAVDPGTSKSDRATIWMVDDDEIMRDMMRRILESLEYKVEVFSSGVELLEAFRRDPATMDLAILDLLMPGMSGVELHQELITLRPELRLLFCSGYTSDQSGELLSLPGVRGFIEKPFTLSDLSTLVRQALE